MAILGLLAAVPVALALLLTGGGSGGGGAAAGPAAVQVTVQLDGGTQAGSLAVCGVMHHYVAYSSHDTIHFRGAVSGKGSWSVKLKLKACTGGTFEDSGGANAAVRPDGSYSGSFPAPIGGQYFARTDVRRGGQLVGRSSKSYFEVR